MKREERINVAVKMLKDSPSYFKNGEFGPKFDVKKVGEDVLVFAKDKKEDSFFWEDTITDVARGLCLSCYLTTNMKYGKIVARIY